MLADKSDRLNSYDTFQPMGPNFLRSWTTLCINVSRYRSCRHSLRFTASNMSYEMTLKCFLCVRC